jgi:cytosine/uracil/thiamine/allantoin permease
MQKILTIAKWVLMAVSVFLFIIFFLKVVPLSDMGEQITSGVTDGFLGWALALLVVCAVAALAFPIKDFIVKAVSNPKSVLKTIIALGVILIIFFISYAMSSGAADSMAPTLVESDEGTRFWSGTGLNALYIVLGLTVLSVIGTEIYAKLKK